MYFPINSSCSAFLASAATKCYAQGFVVTVL